MSRARSAVTLLVLTAALVSGCGGGSRPSVADWQPRWESLVTGIPDQAQLGDPPDETLCDQAVALIRDQSQSLTTSPDPAVDDLVQEWIRIAEAAFFDCPPEGPDVHSFDDAYSELSRIEAEIDLVLGLG